MMYINITILVITLSVSGLNNGSTGIVKLNTKIKAVCCL